MVTPADRGLVEVVCVECGRTFPALTPRRQLCGGRCAFARARRRLQAETGPEGA